MYAAAMAAAVVATAMAVFVALMLDIDLVALAAAELAAFLEADCEAEATTEEARKADELAALGFAEDDGLAEELTAREDALGTKEDWTEGLTEAIEELGKIEDDTMVARLGRAAELKVLDAVGLTTSASTAPLATGTPLLAAAALVEEGLAEEETKVEAGLDEAMAELCLADDEGVTVAWLDVDDEDGV